MSEINNYTQTKGTQKMFISRNVILYTVLTLTFIVPDVESFSRFFKWTPSSALQRSIYINNSHKRLFSPRPAKSTTDEQSESWCFFGVPFEGDTTPFIKNDVIEIFGLDYASDAKNKWNQTVSNKTLHNE